MGLDIRLPIGALFTFLGVMLAGYGLRSDPVIYQRSLGININLDWGIVLLVFGLVMIVLGRPRQPEQGGKSSEQTSAANAHR